MQPSGARIAYIVALVTFVLACGTVVSRGASGAAPQSTRIEVGVAAAPDVPPAPAPSSPLQDAATGLFSDRPSCAVAKRDGQTILAHNPDLPLTSASTQKVLVAAAALHLLGPDHRFRTTVRSVEPPVDGAIGHLWLVGGGDPGLATPGYADYLAHNVRWESTPPTSLAELADHVVAAGVRHVRGQIHADETRHEPRPLVADWTPALFSGGSISPLSSLTVNGGWAQWVPSRAPTAHPALDAAGQLTHLLRERGVLVDGDPAAVPVPAEGRELAAVQSAPLVQIVTGLLRASDNVATEMLVREIGIHHAGSATTDAGIGSVGEVLGSLGVAVDGLDLKDGSGLSRSNRATCRTLVEAVGLEVRGVRIGDLLAVGGRNGTLYRRFGGTPLEGRVLGKTGSVTGANGLTGRLGDGRTDYAVLQNEVADPAEAREREDQFVHLLAGHP